MSPGRGRSAAAVRAALATTALLVGSALLPGLAHAAPAPDPTPTSTGTPAPDAGVVVRLVEVSPPVVEPASTLVVRTVVHNGTADPLPAGLQVELRVQRSQLSTRASVRDWTAMGTEDAVGSLVTRLPLAADLPPGGQVAVDLAVPATELRLAADGDDWGPRGLSVVVRDDDAVRLAVTRSLLVWYPTAAEAQPTSVTVLVPLTAGAPDATTGAPDPARLTRLTAAGGALDAELAAASVPGVTPALDPALLADATPSPSVTAWTTRLQEATAGGGAVLLPYGDADLASLVHADAGELARAAQERAVDVVQRVLTGAVRTDVAWPLDGRTDPTSLGRLRALGYGAVVLSAGAAAPVDEQDATLTGRADLDAGGQRLDGLLSDSQLSDALAQVGRPAGAGTSPAGAVQQLLAETAAVTLERPSDPRHLLVTAPRGWAPTPQAAVAAVQALTAVPWVVPASLQELVDTPAPDVERSAPDAPAAADELPAGELRSVQDQLTALRGLAGAVADPTTVTAPAELSAVALASGGWRPEQDDWRSAAASFTAGRQALQDAVRVVPGSALTQVSREVQLPVTVENTLDQPVSVVLQVRSTSSRLVVTDDVRVDVPPGTTRVAYVPVRGVGSGDATVVSQVVSPAGAAFGRPVSTRVTVRADWETRGTLAVAILAGIVLVAGLVRTIRRGRRPRGHDPLASDPADDPPDADGAQAVPVRHETPAGRT